MIGNKVNSGMLSGIRLIDLSDEKGHFCTKLLADMGATVIKVEKPGGDATRMIGPFWGGSPNPERSLSFLYHNINKQDMTLNIEYPADRAVFTQLIKQTDVLVESFSPGYLEELGLGYDSLKEMNQRLIMASITGFGQTGPRKYFKSCDLVASAFGGQMYVSGSPSMPPVKQFGNQSYFTASLFAAVGILLALLARDKKGRGDYLDISLQEAVTSSLDHVLVRYFNEKAVARRQGGRHWNHFFIILECMDGFIQMTPFHHWETLVEWLNSEGMAEDLCEERWCNAGYRLEHADHVIEVLRAWTMTHTSKELFELGQLMRFPWAPVYSLEDVLESPQLEARNFFIDYKRKEFPGVLRYPGLPYKSSIPFTIPDSCVLSTGEDLQRIHKDDHEMNITDRAALYDSVRDSKDGPEGILAGIRILDFTRVLAGPYATRILGDFGAEVIKVQSRKGTNNSDANLEAYFSQWNRNKRSITLDMGHPDAREIVLRLTAISDVVVENFTPRVMSNWGLDYEELRKAKQDLIYVGMSGFGNTGPWKDFVAFAPTIQSLAGHTFLNSYDKDHPTGVGYSYADTVSGLYSALAILAALKYRDETGLGQFIDLSEYEALCTLIGSAFLDSTANHVEIKPRGNRSDHISAAPYGCYPCLGVDRWCVIAVFNEDEWISLCHIMGDPSWARADDFSTMSKRKLHESALDRNIQKWTMKHSPEDIVERLQGVHVAAGVVQNAEDLANDPQLTARHFFQEIKHPILGVTKTDRIPIMFRSDHGGPWTSSPLLGEANQYVYRELLGLSGNELFAYKKSGVIG